MAELLHKMRTPDTLAACFAAWLRMAGQIKQWLRMARYTLAGPLKIIATGLKAQPMAEKMLEWMEPGWLESWLGLSYKGVASPTSSILMIS